MVLHLRERRRACGLSLQTVGDDIDRSTGTLSELERGLQPVNLTYLEVLARRYRCHPWDLVSFPEFTPPPCRCHTRDEETG